MLRRSLSCLVLLIAAVAAPAQVKYLGWERPALRAADATRLAEVGGAAAAGWLVQARAPSGAVSRIAGTIPLAGANTAERMADLLQRFGPLFDVGVAGSAVTLAPPRVLLRHPGGADRFVRLAQVVHGLEVAGHGLDVELDEAGDARCIHGVVSAAAAALPAPVLRDDEAIALASARLETMGHDPAAFRTTPSVIARLVAPVVHGLRGVLRVGVVVGPGHLPMGVDLDAADGTVLAAFEDKVHGTGTFFDGPDDVLFQTGTGKGVVYKSFKDASINKPTLAPLKELGFETAVPVLSEDGSLFGRFAWVLNENPPKGALTTINGSNHQFLGFPSTADFLAADLFDATNCYFHITAFALFMTKLAGVTLPSDFSMPTLVNTPFEPFNAFFTTQDLGLGTGPGFMVFGDCSFQTGDLMDDLAKDPTVMCHEYLHAIGAFTGLGFGAPPQNSPNRAVNEAIADYFAATFFKDPRIGFPIAQIGSAAMLEAMGLSPTNGLRNLAANTSLFNDLFDVTVDGIPEEHFAGNIFGATLWSARTAVKQRIADDLIFQSMFNWPQDLSELGFETLDETNAEAAYVDFFAACLDQLVFDAFVDRGAKVGLKVLGASMRHGGLGMIETGTGAILDLTPAGGGTLDSAFLGSSVGHQVHLALQAGQTLDVSLAGSKKTNTQVDLDFLGPDGGLTLTNPPTVTSNTIKLGGIQVNTTAIYTVRLFNDSIPTSSPLPYKFKFKAK